MTRRLIGYLLVALGLIAGYLYHQHLRLAPAPVPAAVEHKAAPAAPVDAATGSSASPGIPGSPGAPASPVSKAAGDAASPSAKADIPVPGQESAAVQVPAVDGKLLARLKNGLTVLVVEDKRFPLVAERLYVRAGSAYETPEQGGISHLLEHMVFNSTVKRQKGAVASDIESAGGDTNAATSFDYTQYMANLPASRWKLGLDVFQDMIFGAKFDPAELEQEKKVVISELERGQDDPGQRLFNMSQAMAWKGMPYERPIIGTRETVNAVTSQALHDYVKRFYQPQSMLLVVVGDVSAKEVFAEAEAVFGSLVNDRPVVPPDTQDLKPGTDGPQVRVAAGDWNKCYLRLNFTIPGMHSARDIPLTVLAELLGGGRSSRLYREFVYEKRLADDIDVSAMTLERGGMFTVSATLDQDKLDTFLPALVSELSKIDASGFTGQEMDRTKLGVEDSLYKARETLSGLASKMAYYQFFGFGQDGEANTVYDLRSVDTAQLQGLVGTYLDPANLSLGLLIPGKDGAVADAKAGSILAEIKRLWPVRKAPAVAADAKGGSLKPEVVDLGAGRTVVLLPDHTMPYAAVTLAYRGGDGLLAPGQQGLGELAGRALTRSTTGLGATQMQDYLEDRAASISAGSGRDTFTVSARYPSRFAAEVNAVFADVILKPAFDPAEVDRARQMQLAQIAESSDRPTSLAFRNMFPFLFPGTSYGYFRSGQPAEVKAFTPGQARAFWEKQRTMPWVLSVCGTFDREQILKLAGQLAGPHENAPPAFPDPSWTKTKELTLTLPGRNQTHLFWIFPVEGRQSVDTAALEALNTALAGQGGLLFQDLRDKQGLGYSVTSFLWQSPTTGFLAFYIGTTPDKEAQAMEGFKRVASELAAGGIDEARLNRAKNSMEGDYYQGRQSLGGRSAEASQNLAMGYPLDQDKDILEKVKALAPAQVAQAAKKYLDQSRAYVVKVEP